MTKIRYEFVAGILLLLMAFLTVSAEAATKSADKLYSEGIELLEDKQYEEAAKKLQAALLMDPGNVLIQYRLGITFYNIGRAEQKIEYLEYAQQLWDSAASLLSNEDMLKGTLQDISQRAKNNRDEIARFWELEKLLEQQPDLFDEGLEYAALLKGFGEVEQAENQYRKLLNLNGDRPEPLYGLAELVIQQGRLGWAKSYYQRALKIDPNYLPAQEGLTELISQLETLSRFSYEELLKRSH